jgi:predicted nucleic acid-binding Zn ribbon protein
MSPRYGELACGHCRVFTRVEFLVDVSELAPFCSPVCEECEHDLVADYHDDPSCRCASCNRARSKADRIHREAEAALRGGLSAEGIVLVGLTEEDL